MTTAQRRPMAGLQPLPAARHLARGSVPIAATVLLISLLAALPADAASRYT